MEGFESAVQRLAKFLAWKNCSLNSLSKRLFQVLMSFLTCQRDSKNPLCSRWPLKFTSNYHKATMDLRANPVILVISPLVSLMEDQTNFLQKLGISAGSIGEDKALDLKIEKAECSVVFLSLESLLGIGRWRSMLSSDVHKNNLIGIIVEEAHRISHW